MTELLQVSTPETYNPDAIPQRGAPVRLHSGLALLSIVALLSSSLEVELLEQLDSLSLYMTYREIALDVSVALLFLLVLAFAWWLGVLLLASAAKGSRLTKRYSRSLVWHFGLALPLSYFAIDIFNAARLAAYPRWQPELLGWGCVCLLLCAICIGGLCAINVSAIQEFCRIRVAPVGGIHVVVSIAAIFVLWAYGVRPFHNYARASDGVSESALPDIYLITIDALRAEDTSVYGYDRPTTPNLERFAQRSFTFDYFFANSNLTTPTTTTIETGKLPWSHRVFQLGGNLRGHAQQETLAGLLRQRGYYTASIASNYAASPTQHKTVNSYDAVEYVAPLGLSGMWQQHVNLVGLNTQHTLSLPLLNRLGGIRFYLDTLIWSDVYTAPAEAPLNRTRALLDRTDITQPRFVWTHILPPHDPYLAPEPYRKRFLSNDKLTRNYRFIGLRNTTVPRGGVSVSDLRARYDESILYADHAVGDYLDWLDRTGRLDRAIVVVSADHGESFEHNWLLHGGRYLYDGVIHIPFLIHLPGQKRGERINRPAQEADLLPTLMDLIGAPAPNWTDGLSLKPLLEGKPIPERSIFAMALERNSTFAPITKGTFAVIDNEFKYVNYLGGTGEALYRYRVDEFEDDNLAKTEPEVAGRMRDLLLNTLKEVNQHSIP
jgi:arylsulfatase A-like enzyme